MDSSLTRFLELGLSEDESQRISNQIHQYLLKYSPEECWQKIKDEFNIHRYPFPAQKFIYDIIYPNWDKLPAPTWFPSADSIKKTHIGELMMELGFTEYQKFHDWSVTNYPEFWEMMVKKINIIFDKEYKKIVNLSDGIETPHWFAGAKLNIINSCFQGNETDIAIIEQTEEGNLRNITYGELNQLSNRVANSLARMLNQGDRVAIVMPMNVKAIAIYIGIIKAGCCVVSIPDSFSANEIAIRIQIADTKIIFSQDSTMYEGKHISIYEKIIDANAPVAIVISTESKSVDNFRKQDMSWDDFLSKEGEFISVSCHPDSYTNILFSSGTTGDPKGIPWTHTTPVKCATDAYLYHNVQPGEIICWPTNLGWMMGPWLIYAGLVNKATIALFNDTPNKKNFGKFVQDAKVTILGVVPTQVKNWRRTACMEGLDWSSIKLISSSAECSNTDDMLYLMSLINYKPIIEYCGGSEIGGAYITGTLVQPCAPSAFTTPALGLNFKIIDEDGLPVDNGEGVLIPPSIGLSTELLNKNHHRIYYADVNKFYSKQLLRRHGDQIEKFPNGFYRLHGRVDDTMNLSGVKISSAEIEKILDRIPQLHETAAIAINTLDGGPSQLVIYAVTEPNVQLNIKQLKNEMQNRIKTYLNPLCKITDVVIIDRLPRNASNKIMRKTLREEYKEESEQKHITITEVKDKKSICLALQGGGSFGAYTWGILDRFLEDDRLQIEAISATSAGSINASILASGILKGGNQGARFALRDFWQTLSQYGEYFSPIRKLITSSQVDIDVSAQLSFVFFDFLTRTFSPYILNPFDFDLLRLILLQKIDFDKLRKKSKIKLFLSATNVKTGMLRVFENAELSVDAVLASACLPNLHQAIQIDGEYYWDGGYLGNPAIYPLIYNSQVDDILIIHNNPIARDVLPITSSDIASRENEISFNSSLIRELRAIAFITKLIDKGWVKEEYKQMLRRKYIHILRSDEVMNQFNLINKFNWQWNFISHLYYLGRTSAETWLKTNFDHLGKKPTIDFGEFLGSDTQTS